MWIIAVLGCPETATDGNDDDVPADTDTDADADADSDTDDTDPDTDTDATGDTDTDTDPGTDTDDDCDPAYVIPTSDSDADLALVGTDDLERTAESLVVTDHDGDGIDDLVVGSPEFDSLLGVDAGRLWILYGPLTVDGTIDAVADGWVDADGSNDQFTRQLADVGDLDGDGITDLASFALADGEVWIRYGSSVRLSGASSVVSWDAWVTSGYPSQDPIGDGVTGPGDLDGDGHDEMVFANPWFDDGESDSGRLYVLAGSAQRHTGDIDENALPFVDGTQDDRICTGRCIAGADYDGDGLDDLALAIDPINFPGKSKVWVRYGDGTIPDGESVDFYPRLQTDASDGGTFGSAVAFVGDLDGDGYPELAVADERASTPTTSRSGKVWLLRGGTRWVGNANLDNAVWLTIEGDATEEWVGSALQGLGDVDCDGFDDLAIGAALAEGVSDLAGVVGVWLAPNGGAETLDDATAQILGVVGGGGFGASLATGDVDADGISDLVVGAPEYAFGEGRAYLFLDVF